MPFLGKSGTSRMSCFKWSQLVAASGCIVFFNIPSEVREPYRNGIIFRDRKDYHAPSILNLFKPGSGLAADSSTASTRAARGPARSLAAKAANCSALPLASTSTAPSKLLRTQPLTPSISASRCTNQRNPTPCTRPRTTNFLAIGFTRNQKRETASSRPRQIRAFGRIHANFFAFVDKWRYLHYQPSLRL